ncbi:MAG: hypothetical protein HOI15_11755 [Opitutales bacterium]|nr:hypothetical protein [Opitutales bacterium]
MPKLGKKAFQLKAVAVTSISIEDSFLNVPEDFKLQGGGIRARPSVPGPVNSSREEKDAKAADGQGKRVKGLRIVLAAKSRKKAQEK